MSEIWQPKKGEKQPVMRVLSTDDKEIALRRMDTVLFTFLGDRLSLYDHIYHIDETGEIPLYIFEHESEDQKHKVGFTAMKAFMLKNNYPASTNSLFVPDGDIEAYRLHVEANLEAMYGAEFNIDKP